MNSSLIAAYLLRSWTRNFRNWTSWKHRKLAIGTGPAVVLQKLRLMLSNSANSSACSKYNWKTGQFRHMDSLQLWIIHMQHIPHRNSHFLLKPQFLNFCMLFQCPWTTAGYWGVSSSTPLSWSPSFKAPWGNPFIFIVDLVFAPLFSLRWDSARTEASSCK